MLMSTKMFIYICLLQWVKIDSYNFLTCRLQKYENKHTHKNRDKDTAKVEEVIDFRIIKRETRLLNFQKP